MGTDEIGLLKTDPILNKQNTQYDPAKHLGVFDPSCSKCEALAERLAEAEWLLTRWAKLLSCDYQVDLKEQTQAFICHQTPTKWVVVRRDALEKIRSLSVNIYDLSTKNYNKAESLQINEIVVSVLEPKEEK
jgi:hypothetical protein